VQPVALRHGCRPAARSSGPLLHVSARPANHLVWSLPCAEGEPGGRHAVSILAILISAASAVYTRQSARTAAGALAIEAARRLEERRPRLSGKIEKIGISPDTYQLRVTLDSDEPLSGLDVEMEWTQGFAFQKGGFGIHPSDPGEVALRAFAHNRSDNKPAGIMPRKSMSWPVALVGANAGPARLEATCYGEHGERWDRVFFMAELEADPGAWAM